MAKKTSKSKKKAGDISMAQAEVKRRETAGEPVPRWMQQLSKSTKKSNPQQKKIAKYIKELSQAPTKAEKLVWTKLKTIGGYRFQKGIMLADQSFYIIDIFHKQANLGIEIDGGYHDTPKQRKYDTKRSCRLSDEKNIKIVRCTNKQVSNDIDRVVGKIQNEVSVRLGAKRCKHEAPSHSLSAGVAKIGVSLPTKHDPRYHTGNITTP